MHQQRQYVANTSVNFSDFRFFVKPGDLCRHHENTGDFIIFRNGALLAKLNISIMALKSMMTPETQFFSEIKPIPVSSMDSTPSSVVVIEEPDEEIVVLNDTPSAPSDAIDGEEQEDELEDGEEEEDSPDGAETSSNEAGEPGVRKKRRKK